MPPIDDPAPGRDALNCPGGVCFKITTRRRSVSSLSYALRAQKVASHMLSDTVATVLIQKGAHVYSVAPDQAAIDAMTLMGQQRIAAVLVVSAGRPVGIVSAKDYGRRVALEKRDPQDTKVSAIMTSPVVTVSPEATVSEAMAIMAGRRIRHLPVMDRDQIAGIVSIGDLARSVIAEQTVAIDHLHGYIGQKYPG
jgi:CBS domain-containing protein